MKNLADAISAGMTSAEIRATMTVAIPSRMKIHLQPASPPIPSILMMADARRPGDNTLESMSIRLRYDDGHLPPKAPDSEADA